MSHALRRLRAIAAVVLMCAATSAAAAEITVAPGQSLQAAIDKAPHGATITLAAGVFDESVTINKPLTLRGAGWQKTALKPSKQRRGDRTQEEKLRFADELEATKDPERQMMLVRAYLNAAIRPTINVSGAAAKGVTLHGIKVHGVPTTLEENQQGADVVVEFRDHAQAKMIDCAVLGPGSNGVLVKDGADVEI